MVFTIYAKKKNLTGYVKKRSLAAHLVSKIEQNDEQNDSNRPRNNKRRPTPFER
jgi:hypothetical protein